jgi:hypothetical protein
VPTEQPEKILFIKQGRTFPRKLMLAFKAECCHRGKSMTWMIAKLIKDWLDKQP